MSASNWALCPVCTAQAEGRKDQQVQAATDAYGKVPVEEFDALRALADTPLDTSDLYTFREDYEFYLDGTDVRVSYEGRCTICRSGIKFKDSRPIHVMVPPVGLKDLPRA